MAFGCVIFLREECNGCGRCQEPRHGSYGVSGSYDTDIPFSDNEYDEDWEDEVFE